MDVCNDDDARKNATKKTMVPFWWKWNARWFLGSIDMMGGVWWLCANRLATVLFEPGNVSGILVTSFVSQHCSFLASSTTMESDINKTRLWWASQRGAGLSHVIEGGIGDGWQDVRGTRNVLLWIITRFVKSSWLNVTETCLIEAEEAWWWWWWWSWSWWWSWWWWWWSWWWRWWSWSRCKRWYWGALDADDLMMMCTPHTQHVDAKKEGRNAAYLHKYSNFHPLFVAITWDCAGHCIVSSVRDSSEGNKK